MADYAFRTLEDRQKIEKLWEDGRTPKEISVTTGVSVHVVYKEMTRGQDGTRLPDQRLRYSAELAQRRVQASLERRGKRTGQPTNSDKTAGAATRSQRQCTSRPVIFAGMPPSTMRATIPMLT